MTFHVSTKISIFKKVKVKVRTRKYNFITDSINVSPESYNVLGDQNYAALRHLFGFTDEQYRIVKIKILYV